MWIQQAGGETPDSAFECTPIRADLRSQVEAVAPASPLTLGHQVFKCLIASEPSNCINMMPQVCPKNSLISFNVVKMGCPASPSGSRRDWPPHTFQVIRRLERVMAAEFLKAYSVGWADHLCSAQLSGLCFSWLFKHIFGSVVPGLFGSPWTC